MIRTARLTVLMAFLLPMTSDIVTAGERATFQFPAGQRQLFVDDHGIAEIDNLSRTMHQPDKKGAVVRPDFAAGQTSIQTRSAPFWDPKQDVFKFWVGGALRQSTDGLNWGQIGQPDLKTLGAVFFDPMESDPSRQYKSFSPGQLAVSPDGLSWSKLDVQPVPSQDEHNFSIDETAGLYIATVKHRGPFGRSVYLSTSRDFEHWTKPELIFHADERDQELGRQNIKARFADASLNHPPYNDPAVYNVDVYNMGVFRYEGLYLGTPAMFHSTGPVPNYPNTVGFHLVQLASSRDLKTWRRLGDRKPFIGPSPLGGGAYDLTQIIGPSSPIVRGDELWFYYTGIKYRGGWKYVGTFPNGKHVPLPGYEKDTGAICLAVLRRDGFISLDAGPAEGVVLTEPFTPPGKRLLVNVDAGDGELRVEAIDGDGSVLAQSVPLSGDHRRVEVKWQQGGLAKFQDRPVRLRFTLTNASFYSYWLP